MSTEQEGVRRLGNDGYVYQDQYAQPPAARPQHPTMRPAPAGYGQPAPEAQAPYQPPPPVMHAPPVAAAPAAVAAAQGNPPPPSAPPPSSAPAAPGEVVFSRAYKAHNDDVTRVRFRKPTTADLRRGGFPLRAITDASGKPVGYDELPDVVCTYITLLSEPQLPRSTVDQLEIADYNACSQALLGFFMG